jgi:general nucleoside transport system permease protein
VAPFDAAFLSAALVISAPLLVAACGELVGERAGIINVGLEGMMLTGAFTAYLVAQKTGSLPLGFAGGLGGALCLAVVMAVLSIEARADQIVAGIGINLVAVGITSFLDDRIYEGSAEKPLHTLAGIAIPGLSSLGGVGKALFDQDIFVYLSFVLLIVVAVAIQRTPWGIALRAVGESPAAADAAGVSVRGVRWAATLFAGSCAGLAGAYLSIGELGVFHEGMTAGRGFIALAAVIFGRWRAVGVLGACLIFGGADALQLRLQALPEVPQAVWWVGLAIFLGCYLVIRFQNPVRTLGPRELAGIAAAAVVVVGLAVLAIADSHVSLPSSFWLGAPFVLALLALTGAGHRRTAMPSSLAIPYSREQQSG